LAGRDATRIQASGGYAANLLRLSEQVPMKVVYLTDGPNRTVRLGKAEIILKHTTPRDMATAGRISGLVIQALKSFGRRHVDEEMIRKLGKLLSDDDKKRLMKDIRYAPGWIAEVFRRLNEKPGTP
jgi:hypothetical protein